LKIAVLTKEFPPYIYGGAGVHVDYLTENLAKIDDGVNELKVICFGDQYKRALNLSITGVQSPSTFNMKGTNCPSLIDTLIRDALMAGALGEADLIHCHTWYTHLAGCILKQMLGVPLVLTAHSLEPLRPWKKEQLGRAYFASSWVEKTAFQNADGVIAVSRSMKEDIQRVYGIPEQRIEVILNGIDADHYRPKENPLVVASYGINPERPYILMVSRLTRQKGIHHFLAAVCHLETDVQAVMCASAPDTPEFMQEVSGIVGRVREKFHKKIIWIKETVPREDLIVLYSHAQLFVCPSIYEPFGIINLEAMSCGTPVVASAVGGIREVIADGRTGYLVSFDPKSPRDPEPKDPDRFARSLARHIDQMLGNPAQLDKMGKCSRKRIQEVFSWAAVAKTTLNYYKKLVNQAKTPVNQP
jgi:glycogen synthase